MAGTTRKDGVGIDLGSTEADNQGAQSQAACHKASTSSSNENRIRTKRSNP